MGCLHLHIGHEVGLRLRQVPQAALQAARLAEVAAPGGSPEFSGLLPNITSFSAYNS
jgi:hypothetical protein